MLEFRLQPA